jgi:uncharacterized membrane protein
MISGFRAFIAGFLVLLPLNLTIAVIVPAPQTVDVSVSRQGVFPR